MLTTFKKSDDELQIVWGELYAPDAPDSDRHFMSREGVLKTSYTWMAKSETRCIDIEHDGQKVDAFVVESFIARDNDPDFLPGAWVIGVHIVKRELWERVKKGDFNGFSMAGRGCLEPRDIEVPDRIDGLTKSEAGHVHNFSVAYGPDGAFIGGMTDEVDGHYHLIKRGTLTEVAAGHDHQFDFVRGLLSGQG